MTKRTALVCGVVALVVLCAFLYNNFRQQQDTRRELEALKQALDQRSATNPPAAPTSSVAPPVPAPIALQSSATQPASYRERLIQIQEALRDGWKYVNKRDPAAAEQAVLIFKEAIANLDANNADLYNGLGRAELVAGRPRDAIAAWQKGLAINPKSSIMQSGIGWALWNLGDPYDAKKTWEAALSTDPKNADAWSAMAWIYLGLKEKSKSQEGFKILLGFDNKNMAWVQGMGMAKAGNYDPKEIAVYFKLPPLEAFDYPPAAPESQPASAAAR